MENTVINVVILAAGKGTRMMSNYPKVLAPIGGQPLLAHVIETATELTKAPPTVIVGHGADQIKQQFSQGVDYVEQREQLGTTFSAKLFFSSPLFFTGFLEETF